MNLPPDLIGYLYRFLDLKTLIRLRGVCKDLGLKKSECRDMEPHKAYQWTSTHSVHIFFNNGKPTTVSLYDPSRCACDPRFLLRLKRDIPWDFKLMFDDFDLLRLVPYMKSVLDS